MPFNKVFLLGIFTLVFMFIAFYRLNYFVLDKSKINDSHILPVIIWWTPLLGLNNHVKKCNFGSCIFTQNRSYVNYKNKAKVILFYGSNFKIEDLPLPRKPWQWWALLHEESPKNQPIFNHEQTLSLFNLTSTFKYSSGMPLTLQYLQSAEVLLLTEHFVSTAKKNFLLKQKKISPILYLQSDCNPPSKRDDYVREISKFIGVDSYGICLNNQQLPVYLHGIEHMNHPDIIKLIANYKFTIAFENFACEDYITEKLWRPLIAGSVPIYWGSPSIKKWLPNNESIIHVRDFETPQKLIFFLLDIMRNDTLYDNYLKHKLLQSISNNNLISALEQRTWGVGEEQNSKGSFIDAFECFVCDQVYQHHKRAKMGKFIANKSHYGCPVPQSMLSHLENENNFWVEQWYKSETEAKVLINLVHNNFSIELFYKKVNGILKTAGHFQRFFQEEL